MAYRIHYELISSSLSHDLKTFAELIVAPLS